MACSGLKYLGVFLFVLCGAFSSVVESSSNKIQPLISFQFGSQFLSLNDTTQFPVNFSQYIFNTHSRTSSKALFGGFGGIEFQASQNLALQLGLGYYYPLPYQFTGTLTQGVDPQSYDSLTYRYHVQSQQLLVESKLLGTWHSKFLPYLSLGMGAAFNRAYNYTSQTILPPFMLFTPLFSNESNTSAIYMVGVGVDARLNNRWRFGVGYRYNTLGTISLGPALINTTTVQNTLSHAHTAVQNVLFQLTYIV